MSHALHVFEEFVLRPELLDVFDYRLRELGQEDLCSMLQAREQLGLVRVGPTVLAFLQIQVDLEAYPRHRLLEFQNVTERLKHQAPRQDQLSAFHQKSDRVFDSDVLVLL